nr:EamA family transporter [Ursidibacter maritimus]
MCWFNAMSLNDVAFVTVGQIEIPVMFMISYFIFKERLNSQDLVGIFLIVAAALLVVWG